jgi:hypothetical protein
MQLSGIRLPYYRLGSALRARAASQISYLFGWILLQCRPVRTHRGSDRDEHNWPTALGVPPAAVARPSCRLRRLALVLTSSRGTVLAIVIFRRRAVESALRLRRVLASESLSSLG